MVLVITIPFNSQIIPLSCLIIISYKLTTNVDSYCSELVDYTYRCTFIFNYKGTFSEQKRLESLHLSWTNQVIPRIGTP